MQSRRACDQICFSVSSFICIISRTERHSASWLWENDQKKMVLNCFLCLLLLFLCTTNLKHRCLQGHWLFEVTCLLTDLLQDSEQMKLRHNIFCIFCGPASSSGLRIKTMSWKSWSLGAATSIKYMVSHCTPVRK